MQLENWTLGMRVVACARRLDKLESLETLAKKESHCGKIYPVQCDLANLDDIRKLFEFIEGSQICTIIHEK